MTNGSERWDQLQLSLPKSIAFSWRLLRVGLVVADERSVAHGAWRQRLVLPEDLARTVVPSSGAREQLLEMLIPPSLARAKITRMHRLPLVPNRILFGVVRSTVARAI